MHRPDTARRLVLDRFVAADDDAKQRIARVIRHLEALDRTKGSAAKMIRLFWANPQPRESDHTRPERSAGRNATPLQGTIRPLRRRELDEDNGPRCTGSSIVSPRPAAPLPCNPWSRLFINGFPRQAHVGFSIALDGELPHDALVAAAIDTTRQFPSARSRVVMLGALPLYLQPMPAELWAERAVRRLELETLDGHDAAWIEADLNDPMDLARCGVRITHRVGSLEGRRRSTLHVSTHHGLADGSLGMLWLHELVRAIGDRLQERPRVPATWERAALHERLALGLLAERLRRQPLPDGLVAHPDRFGPDRFRFHTLRATNALRRGVRAGVERHDLTFAQGLSAACLRAFALVNAERAPAELPDVGLEVVVSLRSRPRLSPRTYLSMTTLGVTASAPDLLASDWLRRVAPIVRRRVSRAAVRRYSVPMSLFHLQLARSRPAPRTSGPRTVSVLLSDTSGRDIGLAEPLDIGPDLAITSLNGYTNSVEAGLAALLCWRYGDDVHFNLVSTDDVVGADRVLETLSDVLHELAS